MLASYILKSQLIRHFQNKVNYKLKRAKKLAEPFRVSANFYRFLFICFPFLTTLRDCRDPHFLFPQ